MNKLIILCLLLAFQSTVISQSVDELIIMAKDYNPSIKAINLEHDAAMQVVNQKGEYPDPKFNLGIGVLPVETRLGAQLLKIGVSQSIPWKGLLIAEKNLAEAQADIFTNLGDVQAIDIEYAIRIGYSSLLFLDEQIKIIDRRFEILNALEEIAKSAVRSGKGKLSNVLFIQRKREFLEEERLIAQKNKERPTILINRWTGRPFDMAIDVEDQDLPIGSKDLFLASAESEHPQLKVLDSKIAALGESSKLSLLQQKPKIGVGLDYALINGRNDVNIPRNGRDVLMPMASISVPLNTDRFQAKRRENEIMQAAISARADELKDMYRFEIAQAISNVELAQVIANKNERLKLITRETLKLMRVEYASEGSRFEELLRLEMELIDYDLAIEKASYQKDIAHAVLLKYNFK